MSEPRINQSLDSESKACLYFMPVNDSCFKTCSKMIRHLSVKLIEKKTNLVNSSILLIESIFRPKRI